MMRQPLLLCSLFWVASVYGQQSPLKLAANAEKFHFLRDNGYFENTPLAKIKDSIDKLQKAALAAGNDELAGSLMLLTYEKESREQLVSRDTTEYRVLKLATDAHEKRLLRLEADALQTLAELYKGNKEQQSAAIEQYMAANAIYRNFDYAMFPLKQHYAYSLGLMLLRYQDHSNAIIYLQDALHTKTGKTFN